jgi:hypothetical protein
MVEIDQYNILAIELIEFLGNDKPSQGQIDLVEYLLSAAMRTPSNAIDHGAPSSVFVPRRGR